MASDRPPPLSGVSRLLRGEPADVASWRTWMTAYHESVDEDRSEHADHEDPEAVPLELLRENDPRIGFLRIFGTSEELGVQIKALREVRDRLGSRFKRAGTLAGLEEARDVAALAERQLAAHGLSYDPKTDRAQLPPGPSGGHPRGLANLAIGRAWEALQPHYEEETGDDAWTSAPLRDWIRRTLAGDFPDHLLTDDAIKKAIQYHKKRDPGTTSS